MASESMARAAEIDRLSLPDDRAPLSGVALIAAQVADAPIAFVSIVGDEMLWLVDAYGVETGTLEGGETMCHAVVRSGRTLQLEDPTSDGRYSAPLLPELRSYVGVPIRSARGVAIGSLAVCNAARSELTRGQLDALEALATRVSEQLELRSEVAERRRLTERLERSQAALRLALDESPVGIAMCEFDGRFIWVNAPFCEQLGYSMGEMLELTSRMITHPDDIDTHRHSVNRLLAGEVRTLRWRKRYLRKDGTSMDGVAHVAVVRDASGSPVHTVVHVEDVTEASRIEAQERQRQRMESLGTLAGGIAHDFNNLLSVILASAALALEDLSSEELSREILEDISSAANRAADLTRQLLVFSRRDVEAMQRVDIASVVRRTEMLLRRTLDATIETHVELPDHMPSVRIASVYAEQVVLNLAINARDAMPSGGQLRFVADVVTLEGTETRPSPSGSCVRLRVSDTGSGMSPEVAARIFEPFYTTKERGQGTGLGLAIVYGILQEAGGSIDVSSTPGEGTTFEVVLPADHSPASLRPDAQPPSEVVTGHGVRVLIAEDDEAMRRVIVRLLERHDFQAQCAANVPEALALFAQEPDGFDVVLTDVVMPGGTGGDLLKGVRELRPDQPFVLMSGYADDDVRRHFLVGEALPFVRKPFVPAELMAALAAAAASAPRQP